MSYLFNNYKRMNVEFVKAKGNYLIDSNGKKYLDFSSGIGVTNLGFNAEVVNSVKHQLNQIWHTPNLYINSLQEDVAELLIGSTNYLAYFCNSRTEANEAAIKLARKYTKKEHIISFKNSFHGRTYGSMSITGQDKVKLGFGKGLSNIEYAIFNDIQSVKDIITFDTAAIIIELVQGESGIHIANSEFIKQLSNLCKEYGALLIVDEVQTGIGRTGSLYAWQNYEIEPDIFTLAKGLANGLPVGATIGKTVMKNAFSYGSHGSTFGGNKLIMSSAKTTLKIINQPPFLDEVSEKSHYLLKQLNNKLKSCSHITDIRGLGLMIGIQTTLDINYVVEQARNNGLIILTAGKDVIRLLTPLTISKQELDTAIDILYKCLNI